MKISTIVFYMSIGLIYLWCGLVALYVFQICCFFLFGNELHKIYILLLGCHFMLLGTINQAYNFVGVDIKLFEKFINNAARRLTLNIITLGLFNMIILFFASKAYKKQYSLDNIIPFIPILNLYVYWTLSKKYLSIDSALSLFVSGKLAYFIFVKEIKQ